MANSGLPPGATLVSGSLPSQPADVATPDTSVAQSSTPGLPPGAKLVSGTVPTAASPQPSTQDQILQAERAPLPKPEPVAPPQDHKEELVKSIAGDRGLVSYRSARDVVGHVENLIKSPAGMYDAAKQYVQSIPETMKKAVMPEPQDLDPTHHIVNQNPIAPMPGAGAAADAFTTERSLATAGERDLAAGSQAMAPQTAPAPPAASTKSLLTNPFKKLLQSPKDAGVAATQEPGAAAIRTATGAPATTPILSGTTTAADDSLAKVGVAKDAAYKQIDDTVGFDLKAERQKLSDTQYAIKQPGADVPKLQEEIDASTKQIADANTKLKAAGIDPKGADRLNTSWEATKGVKNDIVKSTSSDGTINVKQLLTRSKNARFNPRYGDRLAQAFGQGDAAAGKPIADAYIQGLEAAQKAGVQAVKAQKIKLWVSSLLVGGAGAEGVKLLLAP